MPPPARPLPTTLIALLDKLAASAETSDWAARTRQAVEQACAEPGGAIDVGPMLSSLSREGLHLADGLRDTRLAITLRRACYAVDRRAAAWRIVVQLEAREATVVARAAGADTRLRRRLAEVYAATASDAPAGEAWRDYLRVDRLNSVLHRGPPGRGASRQETQAALAAEILRRIAPGAMNAPQRRFVSAGPIAALGDELRDWGAPPTDTARLLASLEAYEADSRPALGTQIAVQAERLGESSTGLHRELAEAIEQNYRNANLRVAVSGALLDRFLPAPAPQTDAVNDRIAGAVVRGRASTRTTLGVRLLPDPFQWRLGIEARGVTSSRTFSRPGPVVLRNRSEASFVARKLLTVGPAGMAAAPAVCNASSRTRLMNVSSAYDGVPLLGGVVRGRAHSEYRSRRGLARRQTEARIAQRVSRSLDEQSAPLLDRLRHGFTTRVTGRAEAVGMRVEPVEMRTTDTRLIARLRLAGDGQLAAHTPRNRAPADSLASVQVHESVFNNAIAGLGLSGRRWDPAELVAHLRAKLSLPPAGDTAPTPEPPPAVRGKTVRIAFAAEDPIRLVLAQGRAELILAIEELAIGAERHRRFKVHAFYSPQVDGLRARLVRDEGLHIEGRMRTGRRLKLHGVFTNVLSEDRTIPLLAPPAGDDRLRGLMLTQMVIADGWLGMALGPAGPADRVASVGRYVR
ncbi:MAG: hypothetical protein AAF790_12360 [Planctomycetota bacterium]